MYRNRYDLRLLDLFDPKEEGRHPSLVNGQQATKANGRQAGKEPVEAFAAPVVVLDIHRTPSSPRMPSNSPTHAIRTTAEAFGAAAASALPTCRAS